MTHYPDTPDDLEEPPEGVEWQNTRYGIIELELEDELIEWIGLETEDDETITEWIERQILINLQDSLRHRRKTIVEEVEVPSDIMHRVRLYQKTMEARGGEVDVDDYLYNHIDLDITWTLDDEPLHD